MRQPSAFRRLLRFASYVLTAQFIVGVLNVAQVVVVARALGVAGYGQLVLILAVVQVIRELLDARTWETVITYIPQYQARQATPQVASVIKISFLIDLAGGVLGYLIVLVLSPWLAALFLGEPELATLIRLFALTTLIESPLETIGALFRVNDQFTLYSLQRVTLAGLQLGLVLVCLPAGLGGVILGLVLAGGLTLLLVGGLCWRMIHRQRLGHWRGSAVSTLGREATGAIVRFAAAANLNATSQIGWHWSDLLIVGLLTDIPTAGLYGLAKRHYNQVNGILNPVFATTFPELSRLHAQEDWHEIARLQRRLVQFMSLFALVLITAGVLLIPVAFDLLYEPAFSGAAVLLQLLLLALVRIPTLWTGGYMLLTGHVRLFVTSNFITVLLLILAQIVLTVWFGALGLAFAYALVSLGVLVFQVVVWLRWLRPSLTSVAPSLAAKPHL